MKNRILLLLSDLRGVEGMIKSFQASFQGHLITPILFDNNKDGTHMPDGSLKVNASSLRSFTDKFDFTDICAIYVSFMTGDKVYFIKRAPEDIKVIWSIPGGDLYNRYLRYMGYPIAYKENRTIKYFLGKLIRRVPRRLEFNYLIKRCSAVVCANCDYSQIKQYSPSNTRLPSHIYSIAYPMEKMLGTLYGQPFENNDRIKIVVGNSASRTNNHLYVLKYLESVDVKQNGETMLLLSYGDDGSGYCDKVKSSYYNSLYDSVSFVTDYVPLDEFNRRLLTATHFIYGNWRQEAVGNILTAFYLGGKVYLSKHNPLLDDFLSKGFKVFCLENIDNSFYEPLSIDEKIQNRTLINELYNLKRAATLFKDGLKPFFNECNSN